MTDIPKREIAKKKLKTAFAKWKNIKKSHQIESTTFKSIQPDVATIFWVVGQVEHSQVV